MWLWGYKAVSYIQTIIGPKGHTATLDYRLWSYGAIWLQATASRISAMVHGEAEGPHGSGATWLWGHMAVGPRGRRATWGHMAMGPHGYGVGHMAMGPAAWLWGRPHGCGATSPWGHMAVGPATRPWGHMAVRPATWPWGHMAMGPHGCGAT